MSINKQKTRPTPTAIAGGLLAGFGALLLASVVIGNADDGRGFRGLVGAVLLVGGLIIGQLATRLR
jgi:formate/nitrite transporter FocA (FNT family)